MLAEGNGGQFYYVRSAAGNWHVFYETPDGFHWTVDKAMATQYSLSLANMVASSYPLAKCTIVSVAGPLADEIPLEHQALSAGALKGQ
jgi:hypothetical protein